MPIPVIARGAALLAREKRAARAVQAEREARRIAQSHNIKNAEVRYREHAKARTLQEQLRNKLQLKRKVGGAVGPLGTIQSAMRGAQIATGEENTYRGAIGGTGGLSQSARGARKNLKMLQGLASATHLSILGWSALLQFVFAIVSLVAFGAHAGLVTLGDGIDGGFLAAVAGFLPFEMVGYGCWGIVMLITLALSLGYIAYFTRLHVPILGTPIAFASCAVCMGLNFFIATNIFPWFQIWALYWLVKGVTLSLSSSGSGAT